MIDGTVLVTQDLSYSARLPIAYCTDVCASALPLKRLLDRAILISDIADAIDVEDVTTAS